jgi:putative nucleotidyltransferase with HDIG domain
LNNFSISKIIRALAATVKIRDPYTVDHQRRVAYYASAIAREIGLAKDTVKAIELAGIIHDIGKISVPAEILNKSGKLSPKEFSLIKDHPQTGCKILRDAGLPFCPITHMVLQYHERLNGSGYPQGLRANSIALGAAILAVADVVEAMSSNRPYRPALGIDAALSEIKGNKGRLYDPDAVDACERLLKKKELQF